MDMIRLSDFNAIFRATRSGTSDKSGEICETRRDSMIKINGGVA
jgi:hypothetical protein